jgi:hypothetical protein
LLGRGKGHRSVMNIFFTDRRRLNRLCVEGQK